MLWVALLLLVFGTWVLAFFLAPFAGRVTREPWAVLSLIAVQLVGVSGSIIALLVVG